MLSKTIFEHQPIHLPFRGGKLQAFQNYLQEIWQRRIGFGDWDEIESDYQPFLAVGGSSFAKRKALTRNYVGCIRFQDWELNILPKIFQNNSTLDLGLIWRHLLYYLSYSSNFHFPHSWQEADTLPAESGQEIWWYWLVSISEEIYQTQAYKMYQNNIETTNHFQGRLATSKYIQESLNTGNWQELHCEYAPWQVDNTFNQIVKYVLQSIKTQTTIEATQIKIEAVLAQLNEVSDSVCQVGDCAEVRFSALLPLHPILLESCKVFLQNEAMKGSAGHTPQFCWLLPMERVYEQFLAGFIRTHFPAWQAEVQSTEYLAQSEGKAVFPIRNDIYLTSKNVILDTKYKLRPTPFKDRQAGVSAEDMYQMLSYGVARRSEKVILLYPALLGEQNLDAKRKKFTLATPYNLSIEAIDLQITLARTQDFKNELDKKISTQLNEIIL
jgi:5-methylcytosine-specific restriction enzyme subunit McrC